MLKVPTDAKEKRSSSIFEIVEELNHSNQMDLDNDDSSKHLKDDSTPDLAKEAEEYQRQYKSTSDPQNIKYKVYGILFLQLCLSSLRAPLYLTIHTNPFIRTVWRQGFIAILYIPISIYECIKRPDFSFDFNAKYMELFYASLAQAIFALSLSVAVSYTHVSFVLMFYNSSLLVYCLYKIIMNIRTSQLEYLGFGMSVMLLFFIIFNHSFKFYSKKDVGSFNEIIFGDLTALFGGSVSTLIYAKFYMKLQLCCPKFSLAAIIRGNSTIILIGFTLIFQYETDFLEFLQPLLFLEILLNALFTGVLMNYLQSTIENVLDPISYNSAHFFQPVFGSIFSYILGQESFPSLVSGVAMLVFSIGLIIIQIGRTHNEIDDFQFENIEMRKFDTIVFDSNPLLAAKLETIKEEPKAERFTIYGNKKTLKRLNTSTFIDFSMDQ